MKVIFLDIDGVLNSNQEVVMHHRWKSRWGFWGIRERVGIWLGWRIFPKKIRYKNWRWLRWYQNVFVMECLTDHHDFCPIACSNLEYILEQCPEVKIVVSSVWRNHGSIEWLQRLLRRNGVDGSRIIGKTPNEGEKRGNQIQNWLNANPGVTEFAIIDDDSDMEHLMPKLVQTSWREGLMWRKATEVLRMLGVCECSDKADPAKCWESRNGFAMMDGTRGRCDCYCHGPAEPDSVRRVFRRD